MKKNAFTFIELIVSISIISLVGMTGVFYFHDFVVKQEISIGISHFTQELDNLNNNIKQQKSFDYTVEIGQGETGYIISENTLGLSALQTAQINSQIGTGSISILPPSGEVWELKVYKGQKRIQHLVQNGQDTISVDIPSNIKVESALSGSLLNTLYFNYFEPSNYTGEHTLLVANIIDNLGGEYNTLTINNINGTISYYHNSIPLTSPITIIFGKDGVEEKLELK